HKESTDLMSDANGHWHYCTECSEKLDYEAHTSDGGRVTKQATSYCEGEITYSCTVCGKVLKTEIIPMRIDPVVMGAFANSYIYSYDSDMNKITMNKTRKPGVITVDLGKKYAGKTVTLYEGKNSTEVKVTEGVLDANGKLTFTVDSGKNYTLVVGD
ncbi:MAG: hypothetical protein SOU50_08855, partial [Oscillospiraceae bacterium]|nr:hypothetical protein [Oscillospiraceae bacterium]